MKKLTEFCIRHKVTTILVFVIVVIFGVAELLSLSISLMPDMDIPAAVVFTYYSGASPEDMEELVTRPLESACLTVSGVKEVSSTSSDSITQIVIRYNDDVDLDYAAVKLREKLDTVSLPDDCATPTIINMSMDMTPIAMIVMPGDDLALLEQKADDYVVPAIERIKGVASVDVYGGLEAQVTVEVDTAKMANYGLTTSYISQYLAAENLLYPGGNVYNGTQKLTARTDGKYRTVSDVANTIIPLPTGGTVRLSEVASVYLGHADQVSIARVDGEPGIILAVSKQSGQNEVGVCKAVEAALAELHQDDPSLDCRMVYSSNEYIISSATTAITNIILGVIISAAVLFLFLRRVSATVAISISMPVCILTVFMLMSVCDVTMNMMSLGGIAMGVGMIVDNSIVVMENIFYHSGSGKSRYDACVDGTAEVGLAVLASTMTTVVVFIPLAFTGGMAGMLLKDFCLTIAALLLASLIIALTLVPLLCYFLLDETQTLRHRKPRRYETRLKDLVSRLSAWYDRTLRYFLCHTKRAMLISVGLVVVFLLSCATTDAKLSPDMDQGRVSIEISAPIGTPLTKTAEFSERVSAIAQENVPEIDTLYYNAGNDSATVYLALVDKDQRSRSAQEIVNDLRPLLRDIAGCEITLSASSSSGMSASSDIEVTIYGDDYDTLADISTDLMEQIRPLPDCAELSSTLEDQVAQVNITINRSVAARYGLTAATIGAAVRTELTGATATTIMMDGSETDVMVKGSEISSTSLDALKSMSINSPAGGSVPLSLVADVRVELAPQSITRTNQARTVTISGDTISGTVGKITKQINAILDSYDFPEGYYAEIGGASEDMAENFTALGKALLVAVGLVYFVLASQFESFTMPVIIMMILPIAFTGALFGLPVTRQDITMVSIFGLIMLAGTVVNSCIVLVDYINIRRSRGEDRETAILAACPRRVRPVLMTALTTILAIIPMALGIGDGAEMTQGMGIVMIFGMTISTVTTLFFTPIFYTVIDRRIQRRRDRREKRHEARLAAIRAESEAEARV
ncbi:MAG: efflux RND transporter permease subunit [Clostridiales bacterium]|nr:efflux RND transporter permease subunit [Clostridiales bacterium]